MTCHTTSYLGVLGVLLRPERLASLLVRQVCAVEVVQVLGVGLRDVAVVLLALQLELLLIFRTFFLSQQVHRMPVLVFAREEGLQVPIVHVQPGLGVAREVPLLHLLRLLRELELLIGKFLSSFRRSQRNRGLIARVTQTHRAISGRGQSCLSNLPS
jgi:hypothetical protein